MRAIRPIFTFFLCLVIGNLIFVGLMLAPVLVSADKYPVKVDELTNVALFMFVAGLPAIVMGGLTFGLGFLGLARHLDLSTSVLAMATFGAVAGLSYIVLFMLFLSGLSYGWASFLLPAGVAGSACGALWAVLVEKHARA